MQGGVGQSEIAKVAEDTMMSMKWSSGFVFS